jgi:hypothetical protein
MKTHGVVGVAILFMLPTVAAPVAAQDLDHDDRRAEARQTAMALMRELGSELKGAMQSGGPEAAVSVCTERAPAITARVSREHGWRVTRVSSRYRNPLLGMPDAWETETLERFRERHDTGEPYAGMGRGERVVEGGQPYYRYMQAIPMQGMCVSCHGSKEQLAPGVQAMLTERYPHDRATGFSVGDLRGAFSIRQPLE